MPMKVVVCFDGVRVTVPCGDGNIPVQELITKAVHRYKRATGKTGSHWVEVTKLKTISGGGILDPDDLLSDVVDDREQLIAEFEEQDRPSIQPNGGDGASASSTGTTSPDLYLHQPGLSQKLFRHNSSSSNNTAATDVVVVTPRDLSIGNNLRVRRGSDPGLQVEPTSGLDGSPGPLPSRPPRPRGESIRDSDEPRSESSDDEKPPNAVLTYGSLDRKKLGQRGFVRDALRASLSNGPEMFRWLDAQEKHGLRPQEVKSKERTGPIDGHDGKDSNGHPEFISVSLENDGGPLGIHAIPAQGNDGQELGLLIQSIEQGRPVSKNGRIQQDDIITHINHTSLKGVSFLKAQEIFRTAMDNSEIHLQLLRGHLQHCEPSEENKETKAQPPPVLPKPRSHLPAKPSPLTMPVAVSPRPAPRERSRRSNQGEPGDKTDQATPLLSPGSEVQPEANPKWPKTSSSSTSAITSVSNQAIKPGPPIKAPKKAAPPPLPARNPTTAMSADMPVNAVFNTRKLGKRLMVHLKKGALGLGFSVTSRDNQTDGNNPIYIRNILVKGAAVQDGQLRPGDRLLEVNGEEMTGKTQAEAVTFLRMLPEGSVVTVLVSRQEEVEEKFKVPRQLEEAPSTSVPAVPPSLPEREEEQAGGQPALPEDEKKKEEEDKREEEKKKEASTSVPPTLQPPHLAQSVEDVYSRGGRGLDRLTLDIQLNDTGSAGLGVSVKGKTEPTEGGLKDLGIFVNSVLAGGAASKDGRLQVNDQLLEVNGIQLEGLSNTAAMEALRVAMMEQGPGPGYSTISVARQPPQPAVIHQRSSSATEVPRVRRFGSDREELPSPIPPVRSKRVAALREGFSESSAGAGIRNISYTRATQDTVDFGPAGLRNQSYMKATHDTLNESAFKDIITSPSKPSSSLNRLHSEKENVFADNDDPYSLPDKSNRGEQRPHSSIGFLHGAALSSVSDDEAFHRQSVASSKDENDLSPNDLILPFAREGFGRQSMSEKRKGHLDPRSTETYKQVKANKDSNKAGPTKANDVESGLSSLKKSSSVEELSKPNTGSTAVSATTNSQPTQDASPMWRTNRFGRARPCNDSFRAAVDRSYDALDPALMDTLEEESLESGAFTQEPSNSGRSSISSEDSNSLKRRKAKDRDKKSSGLLKGFLRFGKGRKSNEEAIRRSRSEERSGDPEAVRDRWAKQSGDVAESFGFIPVPVSQPSNQPARGRKTSQQEQNRIDEEYARLREYHVSDQRLRSQSVDPTLGRAKLASASSTTTDRSSPFQPYQSSSLQHPHQGARHLQHNNHNNSDPRIFHPAALPSDYHLTRYSDQPTGQTPEPADGRPNISKAVLSRAEYIQQLRSLYQQRHRQRQGVYPLEDREEFYESQIQDMERKWASPSSSDDRIHEYRSNRESSLPRLHDRPSRREPEPQAPELSRSRSSSYNSNHHQYYPQPYHQQPQQHYPTYHPSSKYHHHPQQQQQQQHPHQQANHSYSHQYSEGVVYPPSSERQEPLHMYRGHPTYNSNTAQYYRGQHPSQSSAKV